MRKTRHAIPKLARSLRAGKHDEMPALDGERLTLEPAMYGFDLETREAEH